MKMLQLASQSKLQLGLYRGVGGRSGMKMSLDPLLHTTTLPLNGIDIGMPLNIIDNIF